jgi:hypothetical protein
MSGDISWEGLVEKKYSRLSFPWSWEKTAVSGEITPIARGVEDFSTRPKASPGKSNSMVPTDKPEEAKREKRWIVPPVVASNEESEAGWDEGVLEDLIRGVVGTNGLEGVGKEDGVDVGAADEPGPGEES